MQSMNWSCTRVLEVESIVVELLQLIDGQVNLRIALRFFDLSFLRICWLILADSSSDGIQPLVRKFADCMYWEFGPGHPIKLCFMKVATVPAGLSIS